jgi:hypothetical protein
MATAASTATAADGARIAMATEEDYHVLYVPGCNKETMFVSVLQTCKSQSLAESFLKGLLGAAASERRMDCFKCDFTRDDLKADYFPTDDDKKRWPDHLTLQLYLKEQKFPGLKDDDICQDCKQKVKDHSNEEARGAACTVCRTQYRHVTYDVHLTGTQVRSIGIPSFDFDFDFDSDLESPPGKQTRNPHCCGDKYTFAIIQASPKTTRGDIRSAVMKQIW